MSSSGFSATSGSRLFINMRIGASVSQLCAVSFVPRGALMMRAFDSERSGIAMCDSSSLWYAHEWFRRFTEMVSNERSVRQTALYPAADRLNKNHCSSWQPLLMHDTGGSIDNETTSLERGKPGSKKRRQPSAKFPGRKRDSRFFNILRRLICLLQFCSAFRAEATGEFYPARTLWAEQVWPGQFCSTVLTEFSWRPHMLAVRAFHLLRIAVRAGRRRLHLALGRTHHIIIDCGGHRLSIELWRAIVGLDLRALGLDVQFMLVGSRV